MTIEQPQVSKPGDDAITPANRLPLEEETTLLSESAELKSKANSLFTSAQYTDAIEGYVRAYDKLPT